MASSRSRPRPMAPARSTWVGPLASTLIFVAIALATAGAGPDRPPTSKVLGCIVSEEVPSPAATASDGGFTFLYQSVGGVAEDGRACTVYRLKNEAGGPPTPVRWLAGDEVLVDLAQLRRCRDAEGCPWFEVARYFDGEFDDGLTQLTFGLNADSFRHESNGLVAITAPTLPESAASVGTEVVGVLALADGSTVALDLVVKSRFERREGVVALIYEVVSSDADLLSGERIALVWPATLGSSGALPLEDDDARPFMQLPLRRSTARSSQAMSSSRGDDVVAIEVLVTSFEYRPDTLLSFVERANPEVALLSVPLPAFVPAEP